jgi:diguanylate cyclase (GGDEF)-like protein
LTEPDVTALSIHLVQAVAGVVLARLLGNFHRDYDRSYLLHWSRSWVAFSVYHLMVAASLLAAMQFPQSRIAVPAFALLAGVAGFLQLGWLMFGAWELARRRAVPPEFGRGVLAVMAGMGAVTSLLFLNVAEGSTASLARTGLRALPAAVAFLFAGVEVWRSQTRNLSFGLKLLSISFVVYGLNQLHHLALSAFWTAAQQSLGYPRFLGLVDFVLTAMMGIGMTASLLDDERDATVQATVEIEHLAYHDALTALPNRLLFMDRLEVALAQAQRYGQRLAVLCVDLDRFKEINDSLGHSVGDELLKLVTERLRRCVRQADTVARFGGDEFGVIIQKIDSFEDAAKVAQKIIETLKASYFLHGRELVVTASIGVSIFPNDGVDAETLVKNADTALYRAKDQTRDNYQLYEPAMNARALERLALENRLRKALAGQELVLFYQPLVDLRTRKVIAFEALLRWNHPELGLLAPGRFMHAAEVSGIIVPIGAWVLRTACAQAKSWQVRAPGVGLSVNLSARQFQQPDLVDQVRSALEESGLPPELLELEITETNAMHDADTSIRTLGELKTLGIRISMDDFGTGYSSLSYLKRFPIDVLKLDQSFIRDITNDPGGGAIATAVITMAHSLSLKVVAEGVETRGQLTFLRERACDRIQGFYFSPPLNPVDFELFIDNRSQSIWHELRELADVRTDLTH